MSQVLPDNEQQLLAKRTDDNPLCSIKNVRKPKINCNELG